MSPELFWIPGPWRGRLAVAARPRGGDWLADEASGWRQAGIDVVVSLLEGDALVDEPKAALANGIRFISFPIPDRGVPASAAAAFSLIADISDALERGQHVAVHCRQTLGRSGRIAAAVLANAGIDPELAIEVVSSARGQAVPETPEQRLWLQLAPSAPPILLKAES